MGITSRRARGVALAAVAAVCAAAFPVGAAAAPVAGPTGDEARRHADVVAFWTNERVAKAVPRDFVRDPVTGRFRPAPLARPTKPGGGGGTTSTTVLGASWTGGGTVDGTTGKVLFAMGGSYYVCSASVVDDGVDGRSVILTAAHCVYDETAGGFATNWMFVPDYDDKPAQLTTSGSFCAQTLYGCWTAQSLVVHSGYTSAGGFNEQATLHDFAFAVVGSGGKAGTQQLDTTVKAQGIAFSAVSGNPDTWLFGYPASGKYKGTDLVYCLGPLGTDPLNGGKTYRVGCTMTGGSSGGPWFSPFDGKTGTGTLMSVNSYGYSGVTAMHGPVFNGKTEALYVKARGVGAGNSIVP